MDFGWVFWEWCVDRRGVLRVERGMTISGFAKV